jgi:hypothetical protein
MNIITVIVLIIIGIAILFISARCDRLKNQKAVDSYVDSIFSGQMYRPDVTAGTTYGIPSFTLKFKTDKEKQHAVSNGLTEQFINNVQELCSHLHPRGEVFDAEQAVTIYSKEDEKCWAEEAAAYRNEKD